tara:strand:- start:1155 stop:1400 length:246 start_codon:yes stop_codon:yes gene_type:complete
MFLQLRTLVRRNTVIAKLRAPVPVGTAVSDVIGLITRALATAVARALGVRPAEPLANASDFSAGNMPITVAHKMDSGAMLE